MDLKDLKIDILVPNPPTKVDGNSNGENANGDIFPFLNPSIKIDGNSDRENTNFENDNAIINWDVALAHPLKNKAKFGFSQNILLKQLKNIFA